MTVKEMHIGIDMGLQRTNSNRLGTLSPEQKDWVLQEATLEFIKTRTNPKSNPKREGFEDSQKRYDDISELMRSAELDTYVNGATSNRELFCLLPKDYLHLINDRSYVEYNCNNITFPSTNTHNLNVCILPWEKDSSSPYYSSFAIQVNGSPIFTASTYGTVTLNSEAYRFFLINLALEQVNKSTNYELYWEKYAGLYYQNSFILVYIPSTSIPTNAQLVFTGSTSLAVAFTTIIYNEYTYSITNGNYYENRLKGSDIIYKLNKNYYHKTRYNSPLSYLENGKLFVIHNDTFIVDKVKIQYVKKPRRIDYAFNQSCEINANFHEEIVKIAVRTLTARHGDPRYRNIINENLLME